MMLASFALSREKIILIRQNKILKIVIQREIQKIREVLKTFIKAGEIPAEDLTLTAEIGVKVTAEINVKLR